MSSSQNIIQELDPEQIEKLKIQARKRKRQKRTERVKLAKQRKNEQQPQQEKQCQPPDPEKESKATERKRRLNKKKKEKKKAKQQRIDFQNRLDSFHPTVDPVPKKTLDNMLLTKSEQGNRVYLDSVFNHSHYTKYTNKKIHAVNQAITKFAQDNQLGWAIITYHRIFQNKATFTPNLHTFTSFINACARSSDFIRAQQCWNDMIHLGLAPNHVTYTAFLKFAAQMNQDMNTATDLIQSMIDNAVTPNDRTATTFMRAALRWGDLDSATHFYKQAKKQNWPFLYHQYVVENYIALLTQFGKINKAIKLLDAVNNLIQSTSQHESMSEHDTAELVTTPLTYIAIATAQALEKNLEGTLTWTKKARKAIKRFQTHAVQNNAHQHQNQTSVALFSEGKQKEELEQLERAEFIARMTTTTSHDPYTSFILPYPKSTRVVRLLDLDAQTKLYHTDVSTLFSDPTAPLTIEVCSGYGDWIVDRASNHPHTNFIALELRSERTYQIYLRSLAARLHNLVILQGDAIAILSHALHRESIRHLYVNFPEPGGWDESPGLICPQFYQAACPLIVKHGEIVMLTDDRKTCFRHVVALKSKEDTFRSSLKDGKPFETAMPDDYGTSYFDQFWSRGGRNRRFYCNFQRYK